VSRLRAKCPDCGGFTAVAIGPEYECHSCGRTFAAGMVRVPRAWGDGGEAMVESAYLPLPYPEAAVVETGTLAEQTFGVAAELPERPLILGGCCCSHVGAIEGLSARHGRIGVVWIDAHGDLNTPASSPSGNEWGMPLRMAIDSGAVDPQDVALVGARSLDPPEEAFILETGLHTGDDGIADALDGVVGVYVAIDVDGLDADEVAVFMPEPHGVPVARAEELLRGVTRHSDVLGAGVTGLRPDPANVEPVTRLLAALGL
jgi:arginase